MTERRILRRHSWVYDEAAAVYYCQRCNAEIATDAQREDYDQEGCAVNA